jgi:regulator of protease activity HflC (stomatin/prohibitin superfamily)
MVSDAIGKGDAGAINYFIAQDYIRAFEQLAKAPNQKFVLLPTELTNIAKTVGGIGTLIADQGAKKEEA